MSRSLRKQLFKKVKCHIGGRGHKIAQKVSRIIWIAPDGTVGWCEKNKLKLNQKYNPLETNNQRCE